MSEPIRNKKFDNLTAPTPQNTPAQNAPITSRSQQPGVESIAEESLDRGTAASLLAQNPKLLSMIEGKLGTLVGRSSGYIEGLPQAVQRRIMGLKGLQTQHAKLESEFQEELLGLEKKYFAKYTPLYEKRASIIRGQEEPSSEELSHASPAPDENPLKETATSESEGQDTESTTGIPEFWLTAMQNHASLTELITDEDKEVLKDLSNIRMEYLDRPGFRLIFEFNETPFFSNRTISKTYLYREESSYGGEFIYDHAEGERINWTSGKDLTVRLETKKQRNKNTKQTRVIRKTVPAESFFNFFNPPKVSEDEEDDEEVQDLEERLELDYQIGEDIKEKLIPHAVDWFTGEALQYEDLEDEEDDFEGDLEDDDNDDDDELDDRENDEIESDDEDDDSKPKGEAAAECKQS